MTCWRRLAEWNKAAVWQRLHEVLLDRLRAADALDFLSRPAELADPVDEVTAALDA